MDGRLVLYTTQRYAPEYGFADLEIVDLESGDVRRVTATSGQSIRAERLHLPWALLSQDVGYSTDQLWLANLVELGLVTEDGSLIPGDEGVIEFPVLPLR